ncbi:MAG: DUF4249 family protein [Bacteroidia bacterium]|nr:DUF4249 family protein [Bacteroidia bacterium]
MRFNSKITLVFAAIILLFNSCKNELNILAPYKEAVSVYALLNPQESHQYIRINKIFAGEGNAYTMATVNDSVNYQPGVLKVTLSRSYLGNPANTTLGNPTKMEIVLRDTVVQLNPGPFNQNQRLFYTTDKLYHDGEYHLKITNTITGNEFTSTSSMIDSIAQPNILQPLGKPAYSEVTIPSLTLQPYMFQDLSIPNQKRDIIFSSTPGARDYTCIMRFHYRDFEGGDSTDRYLDYTFSTISSNDLKGGQQMSFTYYTTNFLDYMYSKLIINQPSILKRRALKLDFIITAGAQDYADFLKISAPSTSVAQDKPAYTNIDGGGFGIFSCRSRFHISKRIAANTFDYLATKKPYCDLLFLNALGVPGSVCN